MRDRLEAHLTDRYTIQREIGRGGMAIVWLAHDGRHDRPVGDDHLTSTGLALGTPAYVSPEQATAGSVDARTDHYGLAAVIYEMLVGKPRFTGPNVQAVIARRLSERARPLRRVRSAILAEAGLREAIVSRRRGGRGALRIDQSQARATP
jgi:serine/threonine protein kinase